VARTCIASSRRFIAQLRRLWFKTALYITLAGTKKQGMRISTMRKTQRAVGFAAPTCVALAGVWHSLNAEFSSRTVLAYAFLFLLVLTISATLFKRSRGLESAWMNARAPAEPSETAEDPVDFLHSFDIALIVAALAFAACSVLYPYA
jgi:hypothetical protein